MKATVSTKSTDSSEILTIGGTPTGEERVNVVSFRVNYPKDYKGDKYWKNGEVIEASPESAADFEARGLGKIVANEAAEDEVKADEKESDQSKSKGSKK